MSLKNNIKSLFHSKSQNKYDLNAITRLLNLIPNKYTNLNQVLKFIEKAYSINKIKIIQDELNLILCINMPMGFEEEEYKLTLYKVILSNNDIINQIVKELNSIKKLMKANGYSNYDNNNYKNNNNNNINNNSNLNNKRNSLPYMNISDNNIHKKIEELNNKMNHKDALINELNKRMAIKDKEIKDIYSKLIDKDVAIKEMNKTLKKKESQESINQLKIKDEEINKKLNEKAFELNNKLIDKDNAFKLYDKCDIKFEY